MVIRQLYILGICALLGACTDVTQPQVSPISLSTPNLYEGSDPPSDAPVRILWTTAAAYFPAATLGYPRSATVQADMAYDAHHASIGATLFLKGTTSETRTYEPVENHTSAFFGNQHSVTFPMMVPSNCGHTLEAHVKYRAWLQVFSGELNKVVIEEVPETRYASAQQVGCTRVEERTVRSGGGGADCPECIDEPAEGPTWCRVRLTYYVDTGEVISQTILYCW